MNSLRYKIGKRILRRKAKDLNRKTVVKNFDTAKSAVILFNAEVPYAFKEVNEFRKILNERGLSCELFGFVNQKETPSDLLLRNNFSFITKKDLNWFYMPTGEVAERFYLLKPDMLFDLTFDNTLSVQFMIYLSQAKFKIGCFTEEENDFDLMINQGSRCQISYLIEQVQHYINIIQPST